MPTLREMRKRAKELGFIFDVCFLGWDNGERIYNLITEDNAYICIRYKKCLTSLNYTKNSTLIDIHFLLSRLVVATLNKTTTRTEVSTITQ